MNATPPDARRRAFLGTAGKLAALSAIAATGTAAAALPASTSNNYPFSLGVASGSPLPDAVVIWTRILPHSPLQSLTVPAPALALSVRWEMARDEAFRDVVARGVANALPELAHSVHVDVSGLAPGHWYWYRFMLGDAVSPIGRTRTAPAADSLPATLKLAVASCQHWEFGCYGAHRHIAAAAPDLVAFLGDYIYEWGPYRSEHPASALRTDESFTLAQYRARYAQYKTDPDLQAAHLAAPWVVTWDDHEEANDYAAERDERLAPDFARRRAAAYQAFYEHMPLRLPVAPAGGFGALRIYQRYDWGRLARLHLLDDRQYRSPQACTPPGRGGADSVYRRACAELADPARTILGDEQQRWLRQGLDSSPARWNILAQQTLMAQNSQLPLRRDGDGRFWTDGWDGYPQARQRLYDALQGSRAANPLVLSGDVHSFYAASLSRQPERPVSARNPVLASEFCGTSITSPSRPQARTEQYLANNPQLHYGRSDKRGFMLLHITPATTTTLFQALDEVRDRACGVSTLATFEVRDGVAGPARI